MSSWAPDDPLILPPPIQLPPYLGWDVLVLPLPGAAVELILAVGDMRRRHGGLGGGVRILTVKGGPAGRLDLWE